MSSRLYSLSVYETSSHFYVIGSDASEQRFNTLKIDRTSERDFIVGEPEHTYSKADIGELLATVSSSSIVTPSEKWNKRKISNNNAGLLRTVDRAYGIIGAVRFLGGYYLLIATKAKVVVTLGYHAIYKIEDVSMIYIPTSGLPSNNPEEQKYSKLFQTVDFTTNFYFSYTYDLSHTLQENSLAEKSLSFNKNSYIQGQMGTEEKFVWNTFLLKPFQENMVSDKWTLKIVHGFIGYHIVEIPCTKLCLILMARRSAEFAGTRFLKRGTNFNGAVANDVETEQIVWDMGSTPDLNTGKFTSYVQRRGSVPLFWSQDKPASRGVVVKPPIFVDLVEPDALTTASHFRELRRKYGHPVVVMNLVKRREKRHNENLLHEQFLKTVKYLNQFRKPGKCIDYVSFDVSRCHKSSDVLHKLEILGFRALMAHGWFQSFPQLRSREVKKHWLLDTYQPIYSSDGTLILQHGVSRTNCVDCLDRTNVAQFGIGKVALGLQLHAMGYIEEPVIDLNTEICRVLEELYDEHGDTLAWQYAGSQLVHSIKTYKKTAAFQERSRDVFQTISRYYSNNFSDYEKQDGINLFLGIFRPMSTHSRLASDRYLHFPPNFHRDNEYLNFAVNISSDNEEEEEEEGDKQNHTDDENSFKDWIIIKAEEANIRLSKNFVSQISCLNQKRGNPQRVSQDRAETMDSVGSITHPAEAPVDIFSVVNRTFELTSFDQLLKEARACKVVTLDGLNQSLFQTTSFMKMFKSPESTKKYPSPPPLLGHPHDSAASTTTISAKSAYSNNEEDDEDDEDYLDEPPGTAADIARANDEHIQIDEDRNNAANRSLTEPYKVLSQYIVNKPASGAAKPTDILGLQSGLKPSSQVYSFEYQEPSEQDMAKYRKYACMAQPNVNTSTEAREATKPTLNSFSQLGPMFEFTPSFFTVDSAFHTEINKVSDKSLEVYRKACLTDLTVLEPSVVAKKLYIEHAVCDV